MWRSGKWRHRGDLRAPIPGLAYRRTIPRAIPAQPWFAIPRADPSDRNPIAEPRRPMPARVARPAARSPPPVRPDRIDRDEAGSKAVLVPGCLGLVAGPHIPPSAGTRTGKGPGAIG